MLYKLLNSFLLMLILGCGNVFAQPAPVYEMTIKDEGVEQGTGITSINCVGSSVSCTTSGTDSTFTITGTSTPGGSNPQLQYNNAGAFGGVTGSGVDSNGNIGVGSVNPAYKLDVAGQIRATGGGSNSFTTNVGINSTVPSAQLEVKNNSTKPFAITNSTTGDILTVTSAGNVGIGPVSPSYGALLVHVATNQNFTFRSDATIGARIEAVNDAIGANVPMEFVGTRYNFSNAGNVGINSVNPAAVLAIGVSDATTDLVTYNGARSINITNTNQTANNAEGFAFRTTDSNGLPASAVKLMAVNKSHSAGAISGDLAVLTNSAGTITEKMRVTAAGNVGIGTATPQTILDVFGSAPAIHIGNSSGVNAKIIGDTGSALTIQAEDALILAADPTASHSAGFNNIQFRTSNAERMRILGVGNVGIGSVSPGQLLDVSGNVRITGTNSAFFGSDNTASISGSATTTPALTFNTGSATERMRITSAGNIGIGTVAPVSLFHMANGFQTIDGDQNATLWRDTSKTNRFLIGLRSDLAPSAADYVFSSYGGNWLFRTGNVGIGTTLPSTLLEVGARKFNVLSTGNVGVGTNVPGYTFEVSGNARVTTDIRTENGKFLYFGGTGEGITGSQSANTVSLYTNSTERLKVSSAGNVGIGSASPGAGIDMGTTNNIRVPAQKSTTGQRYLCIDTAGQLVSSVAACVGT